jgi:hypothetical protein
LSASADDLKIRLVPRVFLISLFCSALFCGCAPDIGGRTPVEAADSGRDQTIIRYASRDAFVDGAIPADVGSDSRGNRDGQSQMCNHDAGPAGIGDAGSAQVGFDGQGAANDLGAMLDNTAVGFDASTPAPDAAASDAGALPALATLRFPENGHATGSIHVPLATPVASHPLKPKLIWNAAPGATDYRVQISSECALASYPSCAFTNPVLDTRTAATTFRPAAALPVKTTAPVGRRYYWRVQACNAAGCSAFSAVRYVDVGRHRDDFNGDGYADLAVGAPYQDSPESDEGAAYLYFGSATGPAATPDITFDNPLDQASGNFGISIASAGDVNGDGYADLVVGAPYQDSPESDEGAAYLYFGSATGPAATPDIIFDNPLDQAKGYFGRSVASAGDVNGDGYNDLVVGAHRQDNPESDEGTAYLYFGSATGPTAAPNIIFDNPLDQAFADFGSSVASAGDINGDGYSDLVIGAYRQDDPESDEGTAYLYFGAAAGPWPSPDMPLANPLDQAGGHFGYSVASAGDIDGDGYSDLVVGAYRQDDPESDEGAVYLYSGSAAGPTSPPGIVLSNPLDQARGYFGYSVASAGN